MENVNLAYVGYRQNQVRSHLGGLAPFSYEHIIFLSEFLLSHVYLECSEIEERFQMNVGWKSSHLAKLALLTGPTHVHMDIPLIKTKTSKFYIEVAYFFFTIHFFLT